MRDPEHMNESTQVVKSKDIQPRPRVAVPVGVSHSECYGPLRTVFTPADGSTVYAAIFQSRRKHIFCLTVLGIAIALAFGLLQAPYYRAQASVEVDGVNDMYLSIRDISSEATSSLTDAYMQTQVRILSSEMVVSRALEKTSLRKDSTKGSRSGFGIRRLLEKTGLKQFTPMSSDNSGVGRVMQHLAARTVPLTRVIEVVYDDTDPQAAADFANGLVNEYIAASVERRWASANDTEQWLTAYVSHLKQKLEQSGRTLESYAHTSGLLGTSETDTPAQAKLRELQTELSKAHGERVNKQALYDTVTNGPREGISSSINPNPMREYQAKLSDLRSERAQAVATLTPAHYKVQKLEAQIRELEQLVDKEWQKTLALVRSEYEAALQRERLLTDSVQTQLALVAEQAGKRVHYDVLRRELETNQQVYDTILQKAKESAVLSATRPTNIHVVDQAHPPALPFSPNLPIYASVGGLTGLFLGLVWAANLERREHRLITPGMLSEMARVRELGVIPSTAIDRSFAKGLVPFEFHRLKRARARLPLASSFLFSESFHAVVASILRTEGCGTQPRVITITSAMSGDGKTTVVGNLGLALAHSQRRVVLIEGDLRHPKLSKQFEIVNSWGLSDILRSTTPVEDMPFDTLVKATGTPGLSVMPSGPSVSSVSSLLHSSRLDALLESLKHHVDFILIDSPPLLAVSDARILGSSSDAVIFVIRAHKTARETFEIAARQLIDDETPLLGTILNDWNPRRAPRIRDPFQYQYAYRR